MNRWVRLYTDGACSGNQSEKNIGGWGAILEYGKHMKTLYGGEKNTTNNRMEMTALLEALKCLKKEGLQIHVFSDSAYLVNCFAKKWYEKWRKNGWKTANKTPVENRDLWEALLEQLEKHKTVRFYHVKGHLDMENPDQLDKWYENFKSTNGDFFSKEEFFHIVKMNIQADALANQGIKVEKRSG
mgnify:FL=1